MTGRRIQARASGWPCAGRSSTTSAAGYGWTRTPAPTRRVRGARGPCSGSRSRCCPNIRRCARSPNCHRYRRVMADSDRAEPIDVLLVEDDEGDVLMTKEAFEYYKIRNRLQVVTDGEQALL